MNAFIYDIKRIYREPILMFFMFVPSIAYIAIKFLVLSGLPAIYKITGFNLNPYLSYIESICILISPAMLGTVSAFIMIDERDEKIYDLMSVTPLGFAGYIRNRLLMPFLISIIYTFIGHFILNIYSVPLFNLSIVAFFSGLQSVILGLMLFSLSDDKVKGLTYAKGSNGLMITAFADLLDIRWFSLLSSLVPYYWTSYVITREINSVYLFFGLSVHLVWIFAAIYRVSR